MSFPPYAPPPPFNYGPPVPYPPPSSYLPGFTFDTTRPPPPFAMYGPPPPVSSPNIPRFPPGPPLPHGPATPGMFRYPPPPPPPPLTTPQVSPSPHSSPMSQPPPPYFPDFSRPPPSPSTFCPPGFSPRGNNGQRMFRPSRGGQRNQQNFNNGGFTGNNQRNDWRAKRPNYEQQNFVVSAVSFVIFSFALSCTFLVTFLAPLLVQSCRIII